MGAEGKEASEILSEYSFALTFADQQRLRYARELTVDTYREAHQAATDFLKPGEVLEFARGKKGWDHTGTRKLKDIVLEEGEGIRIIFEESEDNLAEVVELNIERDVRYGKFAGLFYILIPMQDVRMPEGVELGNGGHPYNGIPNQHYVLLMYAPTEN